MEHGVLVVRNFLPPSEVAVLIATLEAAEAYAPTPGDKLFLRKSARRTEVEVSEKLSAVSVEARCVVSVRDRVAEELREAYVPTTPQVNDLTLLVEMRQGDFLKRHADAEKLTRAGWVPNHCGWRSLSALVYLNTQGDDFEGGTLSFPEVGMTVAPEAGMLVGFTAFRQHTHEVSMVTAGKRRKMSVWLRNETWRRPVKRAVVHG